MNELVVCRLGVDDARSRAVKVMKPMVMESGNPIGFTALPVPLCNRGVGGWVDEKSCGEMVSVDWSVQAVVASEAERNIELVRLRTVNRTNPKVAATPPSSNTIPTLSEHIETNQRCTERYKQQSWSALVEESAWIAWFPVTIYSNIYREVHPVPGFVFLLAREMLVEHLHKFMFGVFCLAFNASHTSIDPSPEGFDQWPPKWLCSWSDAL
ncbi:hypothetical protein FA15DRAFT_698776, partial [Coprinopsis marcescibilis]